MQDQGTEHTLRGEHFYLNCFTIPLSVHIFSLAGANGN